MAAGLELLKVPAVQISAGAAVAIGLAVTAMRFFRKGVNAEELERQRRLLVNQRGRIGDGLISDIRDGTIYFNYSIHGVDYQATQSVASLGDLIPAEPQRIIGPVMLKYLPRNPANSIVVCETWSGLRKPPSP
ncbi:MAG TPA: hypothetical protein VF023_07460 [Bryobacteraceae bacterium]|jgi:hypothetical protein